MNLKTEIHEIQDGIENIHGDVAYGERQYLYLFKKWVNKLLGADLIRKAPTQWAYKLHEGFGHEEEEPELTIWVESQEYLRGYNARAAMLRKKVEQVIADEYLGEYSYDYTERRDI